MFLAFNMDTRLLRILEEETAKEKERKKARITGRIIKIKPTRKGHILLYIEKPGLIAFAAAFRKDVFELAKTLKVNDYIYFKGEKKVDTVFCDEIRLLNRESNQTKLV